MPESTDMTLISILGAILVTMNQGLKFAIETLKSRFDGRNGNGEKVTPTICGAVDPAMVPLLRSIDKRMEVLSHGAASGTFACKWKDESQVGDHIRDAKETLDKINGR